MAGSPPAPPTTADSAAPAPEQPPPPRAQPESCVKYFDALWFCYSPGHQLRQYYRYGNVDDCSTCWSSLWGCLSQRTRFADADASRAPAHPLWRLRSPDEARPLWEAEFGDGGDEGGGGSAGGEKSER